MASKSFTTLPPNFLASEVGLRVKTTEISNSGVSPNERGTKIVPGGTIYPSNDSNAKGIVFEDVDVTDGNRPGSLIVGGYIFKNRLAATLDSNAKTALEAIGIHFEDAEGIVR